MIAVDSNILVYAHRKDPAWHDPAADALWTADHDISRFATLKTIGPLASTRR